MIGDQLTYLEAPFYIFRGGRVIIKFMYRLNNKKSRKINELKGKRENIFNQKIDLQSQNVDIG